MIKYALSFWLLFSLLWACSGEGDDASLRRVAITDGVSWSGHPSVGTLTGNGHFCTATLVGARTVLTAAHCVPEDSGFTFETEGASYNVGRVTRHPSFVIDPQTISPHDIALVTLDDYPPVTPSVINLEAVNVGLELTLVGYGKTGNSSGFLGDKRMAKNAIDTVQQRIFRYSGSDADAGIGGTCLGDSGGPAFATLGAGEVVVGVVSSSTAECGVFTWDTRVDAYQNWLKSASGGDLYQVATPQPDAGLDLAPPADAGLPARDATVDGTGPAIDSAPAVDGAAPADTGSTISSGDGEPSTLSGGGCRVAAVNAPSVFGLAALFLLVFVLRRRRR